MKKILFATLALMLAVTVSAQESELYPSYVQVYGVAEEEITPDEIYLLITINERDQKGRVSVEQQQRAMVAMLKKNGVDVERQLTMVDLSSSFFKRNNSLAVAEYRLLLHDAATVARIWQQLDELLISQVTIEKMTHSKIEEYRAEVRQGAIRAAKQRATELAEAIDQRIGRCFYIYDMNADGVAVQKSNMLMARGVSMDAAVATEAQPALEFSKIKLSYRVQAKFVLE